MFVIKEIVNLGFNVLSFVFFGGNIIFMDGIDLFVYFVSFIIFYCNSCDIRDGTVWVFVI